jgi:hypothetical protein
VKGYGDENGMTKRRRRRRRRNRRQPILICTYHHNNHYHHYWPDSLVCALVLLRISRQIIFVGRVYNPVTNHLQSWRIIALLALFPPSAREPALRLRMTAVRTLPRNHRLDLHSYGLVGISDFLVFC